MQHANELNGTLIGDDIDLLVNAVLQLSDRLSGYTDDAVTVNVPDRNRHCKYWEEMDAHELASKLEGKYKDSPRMEIPKEHLTEY